MTTINSLVTELQSFVTISRETLTKALSSNITDKSNKTFKGILKDWSNGAYDEDPEAMLYEIETLLRNEKL